MSKYIFVLLVLYGCSSDLNPMLCAGRKCYNPETCNQALCDSNPRAAGCGPGDYYLAHETFCDCYAIGGSCYAASDASFDFDGGVDFGTFRLTAPDLGTDSFVDPPDLGTDSFVDPPDLGTDRLPIPDGTYMVQSTDSSSTCHGEWHTVATISTDISSGNRTYMDVAPADTTISVDGINFDNGMSLWRSSTGMLGYRILWGTCPMYLMLTPI